MQANSQFESLRQNIKGSLNLKTNTSSQGLSEQQKQKRELLAQQKIYYISGDFEKYFEEKQIMGEGCMGVVKKVLKKSDNMIYASKEVKTYQDEKIMNIIKEFKNHSKLDHRNIVKVYELYIDEVKGKLYSIMELVQFGEMFGSLSKSTFYSENYARIIFKQILSGIAYLHDNMVCHRDLKPNNILCDDIGNTVKITDFNVSKFNSSSDKGKKELYLTGQNVKMYTYTGTVAFSAPEVFDGGEYTETIDMWSAGVILYTMLCGSQPFIAEYMKELIQRIKGAKYDMTGTAWDCVSDSAQQLVTLCLQVDPKKRIQAKQALMHRWILHQQNESPFASITLSNLLNSRQRLLTKFSALNQMGIIHQRKQKRNTICQSLLQNSGMENFNIATKLMTALDRNTEQESHDGLIGSQLTIATQKSSDSSLSPQNSSFTSSSSSQSNSLTKSPKSNNSLEISSNSKFRNNQQLKVITRLAPPQINQQLKREFFHDAQSHSVSPQNKDDKDSQQDQQQSQSMFSFDDNQEETDDVEPQKEQRNVQVSPMAKSPSGQRRDNRKFTSILDNRLVFTQKEKIMIISLIKQEEDDQLNESPTSPVQKKNKEMELYNNSNVKDQLMNKTLIDIQDGFSQEEKLKSQKIIKITGDSNENQ